MRTTDGPASLKLVVNFGPHQAFVGMIGARISGGEVTEVVGLGMTSLDHGSDPEVSANGQRVDTCATGRCRIFENAAGADGLFYDDNGEADVLNRVFVVIEATMASIRLSGHGWRLDAEPLTYRYVDGRDSSAVTASAVVQGGEVFLSTTLPGGDGGSLAEARPPCSSGGVVQTPVTVGVGSVQLDGGRSPVSRMCPSLPYTPIAEVAKAGTTWNFHGVAVGADALAAARLLVVDLPAKGAAPSRQVHKSQPAHQRVAVVRGAPSTARSPEPRRRGPAPL
ncbi:MAG: hypothetical protein ACYDGR_16755 [Candidatus Dormibacteria bacterium]